MRSLGFRRFGFGVEGLGLRVEGLGFRVEGLGFWLPQCLSELLWPDRWQKTRQHNPKPYTAPILHSHTLQGRASSLGALFWLVPFTVLKGHLFVRSRLSVYTGFRALGFQR